MCDYINNMNNEIPLSFDSDYYELEYETALEKKRAEWAIQREYYKKYNSAYWKEYYANQKKNWITKTNNIPFEQYKKEFLNMLEESSIRKKKDISEPSVVVPDAHILEEYNKDNDAHRAAWSLLWTVEKPLREAKWKMEEKENQRKWKKDQAFKDAYKKAVEKAIEKFNS
jgi:hypothetical protein